MPTAELLAAFISILISCIIGAVMGTVAIINTRNKNAVQYIELVRERKEDLERMVHELDEDLEISNRENLRLREENIDLLRRLVREP